MELVRSLPLRMILAGLTAHQTPSIQTPHIPLPEERHLIATAQGNDISIDCIY